MPFIPNTPESLLTRSDSKDPGTTCRGITGNGRPCRRSLIPSPTASPALSPAHGGGKTSSSSKRSRAAQLLSVKDDPSDPEAYCWQHRDQATSSAKSSPGPRMSQKPILEGRASLETLMDRLGIVEAQQRKHRHRKEKNSGGEGGGRHDGTQTRPPPSGRPSARRSSHGAHGGGRPSSYAAPQSPSPSRKEKKSMFCFCLPFPSRSGPTEEEEGDHRPARPHPVPLQHSAPAALPGGSGGRRTSSSKQQHLAPPPSGRPSLGNSGQRKSSGQSTKSQTSQYLSLIPPSASPQTASQLMAELAKPISQQDEAGYIYIFWLTPESQSSAPGAEAAESLLSPPTTSRGGAGSRRASDVIDKFASTSNAASTRGKTGGASEKNDSDGKKKILLKIGRTSNVQRRLNEWTRQCGYNLSLIRYYPYIPTSKPTTPRKVPHSHKVEKLVHIELAGAGMRVSDREDGGWKCETCGKAHREWFEVDGTRKGVEMVDEVVRRWADWDETQGGAQ